MQEDWPEEESHSRMRKYYKHSIDSPDVIKIVVCVSFDLIA
jgi:hypothetical protein